MSTISYCKFIQILPCKCGDKLSNSHYASQIPIHTLFYVDSSLFDKDELNDCIMTPKAGFNKMNNWLRQSYYLLKVCLFNSSHFVIDQ